MQAGAERLEVVMRYHERTKHHLYRYAAGPGRLDWANQPDPFRRYAGAALVRLPLPTPEEEPRSPGYETLWGAGRVASVPVTLRSLSRLLEHSLALSAWKEAGGTRWALRANPSSGNLHPTEGYLVIGDVAELGEPGVFHYAPREHALERRLEASAASYVGLLQGFPAGAFLLGFSSVHWREAWKYGERAFRYCQHDAGHALAAVRIAAATLGWSALVLDGVADASLEALLGLDREADFDGAEREAPELVMAVWPGDAENPVPLYLDPQKVRELARGGWYGKANRLSAQDPVPWKVIDAVAEATRKGQAPSREVPVPGREVVAPGRGVSAAQIIRQRRSLLACDGRTSMPAARFYRVLERAMPRPWDALPWAPAIHFGLFVHRVEGLEPGLYALARDAAKVEALRARMHRHFAWEAPPGCPAGLPLYLLERGDARAVATQVSCHQDIAGDGAFSLGMLAEYRRALVEHGPWFYRRLFWEAGAVGQVLYLEAEAAGLRGTGIGCFFDDPVHQVFGLEGLEFQSLYHFTVGGYVDDPRLTTRPPYQRKRS